MRGELVESRSRNVRRLVGPCESGRDGADCCARSAERGMALTIVYLYWAAIRFLAGVLVSRDVPRHCVAGTRLQVQRDCRLLRRTPRILEVVSSL